MYREVKEGLIKFLCLRVIQKDIKKKILCY